MILETVLLGLVLFCAYKIGQWSVAAKCNSELQEAKYKVGELDCEVQQLKFACELFKKASELHVNNLAVCKIAFKRVREMLLAYRIPQAVPVLAEIIRAEQAIGMYADQLIKLKE